MPTILIFHGFGSNAKIAEEQTPNLQRNLESLGFKVEFAESPIKLTPEDFPFEDVNDCTVNDLYCWWQLKGEASLTETSDYLRSKYYHDERIIGVIGISQGGCLSALIAANHMNLIPTVKFGISYGGYFYPHPTAEPDKEAYNHEIDIQFLNVYGDNDKWVPPEISAKLNDFGPKVDSLIHQEGHTFADSNLLVVAHVIEWIKRLT